MEWDINTVDDDAERAGRQILKATMVDRIMTHKNWVSVDESDRTALLESWLAVSQGEAGAPSKSSAQEAAPACSSDAPPKDVPARKPKKAKQAASSPPKDQYAKVYSNTKARR